MYKYYTNMKSKRAFASETPRESDDVYKEERRQRTEHWGGNCETPEQYVKFKLRMLRKEMYINPTPEEIAHLKKMKTMTSIDNAVRTIIDNHWRDE